MRQWAADGSPRPTEGSKNGRNGSGADLRALNVRDAGGLGVGRIILPGPGGVGAGGGREGGNNDGKNEQATADPDGHLCDSCDWRCN